MKIKCKIQLLHLSLNNFSILSLAHKKNQSNKTTGHRHPICTQKKEKENQRAHFYVLDWFIFALSLSKSNGIVSLHYKINVTICTQVFFLLILQEHSTKRWNKLCWSRFAKPVYFQALWYNGIWNDSPMTATSSNYCWQVNKGKKCTFSFSFFWCSAFVHVYQGKQRRFLHLRTVAISHTHPYLKLSRDN